MFDCIIPIGQSCNITFLLQNAKIKKQTTLFEWFVSPNLNDITNVLIKIGNNTDTDIIKVLNNNVFIGDNIYSGHYTYESIQNIYQRRRNRLINIIKSSKNILFCRFEYHSIDYSKKDIDDFINSILAINPDIEHVKLFIISPPHNTELEHPSLINVMYDKHHTDPYCKSQEINDLFINSLEKIGYNLKDTNNIYFTDMDES